MGEGGGGCLEGSRLNWGGGAGWVVWRVPGGFIIVRRGGGTIIVRMGGGLFFELAPFLCGLNFNGNPSNKNRNNKEATH